MSNSRSSLSFISYNSIQIVVFLFLFTFSVGASGPATLQNDDSCDISLAPAATLLLPYFEVDLENANGETTLFTITNVTGIERIARVTLWTDFSYPVVTFNIYLTGFDVQGINLRDVLVAGTVAPPQGTGTSVSHSGALSGPNPGLDLSNCHLIAPGLGAATVQRMQDAFTMGVIPGVCNYLGGEHQYAVGYATIDVVANCATNGPLDAEYFTEDIRYDNVFVGDYQQLNIEQGSAQGNPMVHIRAIPEGGTPQTRALLPTRFNQTFYDRFQPAERPRSDARQPLPSTFAARWINGGPGNFETSLKIWRQGVTTASADCAAYQNNVRPFAESVAFDQEENGEGNALEACDILCIYPTPATLPSSARIAVAPGSDVFPQSVLSTTVSGWVYVNLEDTVATNGAHQGWVVASMRAENRYSVDFDAAWLGNGCSPIAPLTSYSDPALPPVGRATFPTPAGAILPGPAADVTP